MKPRQKIIFVASILIMCLVKLYAGSGITLTTLISFNGTNGSFPLSGLVQNQNGIFYGVTAGGGIDSSRQFASGRGTIFKITTNGVFTQIFSFTGTNGDHPDTKLIQGSNGDLYGTTQMGGLRYEPGNGTLYKIDKNDAVSTVFLFRDEFGSRPTGSLLFRSDGVFYGETEFGGTNNHNGSIFKMTPEGTLNYIFYFNGTNGTVPSGGLVQAKDGNCYGTTIGGGLYDKGTFFKITPKGRLTTLASFNGVNGANPICLMQGMDGKFYGITSQGGTNGNGGTIFMVASNGKLTTLFSFGKITASPLALIQGMDGNLYGTAMSGGTNPNISDEDGNPIGGYGTLFKMTLNGNFTVLYSFAKTNGSSPNSLTQGIDGNFYGTTSGGGAFNQGTVFRLDISSSLPDSK